MSLQLSLLLRIVEMLIFVAGFVLAVAIIEIDRRRHSRGKIGLALRNVAASSAVWLLSTASLSVAALYSATQNYQSILYGLLMIAHCTFVLWLAATINLILVLKSTNDNHNE